ADSLGNSFGVAVRALADCRGRVCVTGVGKAGIIARKVQATLASTGAPSYFLHPSEALHGDLGMVVPDDVVLGFSKSGTHEVAQLFARLRDRGQLLILVTAAPASPAAGRADWVIWPPTENEAGPLNLAPTTSTTAMVAVGDALAVVLLTERRLI